MYIFMKTNDLNYHDNTCSTLNRQVALSCRAAQ